MRYLITILLLSTVSLLNAQVVSLVEFAGQGPDDTTRFTSALNFIKKNYSIRKVHASLRIPAGKYTISQPIILNKYISIEGEAPGTTIIQVKSTTHEGIILEDNKSESDIYDHYNTIRNLTIYGPDFGKNPFEWKNLKLNNPRSVGIKILGLRNRVENCTIDGFLWAGIEISSSYYNFITNGFIKNNRVGLLITNTSTSSYINNNEIRNNSTGIIIEKDSYANFVNNNMIENNITHMLPPAKNDDDANPYKIGDGIHINGSANNFIQNNYFEQHNNNIVLNNARGTEVSGNFFAVNDNLRQTQNILNISGNSKDNTISGNKTLGSTASTEATRIVTSGSIDYSTNKIDFGIEKNKAIKKTMSESKVNPSLTVP